MKLYRIFLPKYFNDGKLIPSKIILKIAEEIREKFGAYSLDPFGRLPIIQGVWTSGKERRYQEEMNILDLLRILLTLKDGLKQKERYGDKN